MWIGHIDHGLPTNAHIIVWKTSREITGSPFIGVNVLLRCEPTPSGGDDQGDYLDISIAINPIRIV